MIRELTEEDFEQEELQIVPAHSLEKKMVEKECPNCGFVGNFNSTERKTICEKCGMEIL